MQIRADVPNSRIRVPAQRRPSSTARRHTVPRWQRAHQRQLLLGDLLVVLAAGACSLVAYAVSKPAPVEAGYWAALVLFAPAWLIAVAVFGGYELRVLGSGAEEYKRVANTGVRVSALCTFYFFLTQPDVSRQFVVLLLAGATLGTLASRYGLRKALHAQRRRGNSCQRVLAIGNHADVADLVRAVRRDPTAGLAVVSACLSDRAEGVLGGALMALAIEGEQIPVVGVSRLDQVLAVVTQVSADIVALTASPGLSTQEIRELGWELETLDVGLVVAPALTNVAGPRIHIRPVSGLPLLHVEDPNLAGAKQQLKGVAERMFAAGLLLLLSPMLLAIAVAIRLDSEGPAIYAQQRMGRGGKPFTIQKFRTMKVGADAHFAGLIAASETPEGMFWKLERDPRVTRLGAFLRRYSLDELPQLLNVVNGSMSLVGPRPLPMEIEQAGQHVRRRLLVRPGMTGLWQISGRSDLPWEEALRFDLYYVENWSLAFDAMILWRTIFVVLTSRGAY